MSERPNQESFAGRRVHVIGLGAWGTGRAAAQVLSRRGADVTVSDVKSADEIAGEIAALEGTGARVLTGDRAYEGIDAADLVVPSPGVPLTIPPLLRARKRGIPIVSEVEVASWIAPCPIVAVTGTKGKSTTTALLGEVLRDEGRGALVGGNIGRPLIALADRAGADDLLVAEVSSFQLEATERFRPRVAVLLNLFADHLDRHADFADYRRAKTKLFANQQAEDHAVINRDDGAAWDLRGETRAQVLPYRTSGPSPDGGDVLEGWMRVRERPICPVSALRLPGQHNLGNALAALLAARATGASLDRAADTLGRFEGLEHRLERADRVQGVTFINDSQATTPEATIAALAAFPGRVVLIAGGRSKVRDFRSLAEAVVKQGADLVVIGEAADQIAAAARAAGAESVVRAADLEEAVRRAYERARPDAVVLLSPACASFDMFRDMAERGRRFKDAVRALAATERAVKQ